MKKNDIQAGVVYGYAEGTSEYRSAHPVIVLDIKTLWTWHQSSSRSTRNWKPTNATRYGAPSGGWSSYWGPTGYLILKGNGYVSEEDRVRNIDAMKALYAEFAETAGNPDAVAELAKKVDETEGVSLASVNNRWILGDYTETKNAEAERDQARREQKRKDNERVIAESAFMTEVQDLLSEKLGRTVYLGRNYGQFGGDVTISFEDLADLLDIKPVKDRL